MIRPGPTERWPAGNGPPRREGGLGGDEPHGDDHHEQEREDGADDLAEGVFQAGGGEEEFEAEGRGQEAECLFARKLPPRCGGSMPRRRPIGTRSGLTTLLAAEVATRPPAKMPPTLKTNVL